VSKSQQLHQRRLAGALPAAWGLSFCLAAPSSPAVPLSIDDIRGSSNQALCHFSRFDRIEAGEIAREIGKRGLDCSAPDQDTAGLDYTPEVVPKKTGTLSPPLAVTADNPAEPTSLSVDQPSSVEEEELAHLQEEVQKESQRLLSQVPQEKRPIDIPAPSVSQTATPFYPPAGVIRISAGRMVGSGFYADESLIVTNAHVVEDNASVSISFSGQQPFIGEVVYRNDDLDFAIIKPSLKGIPLPIRKGPVTIGENIIAMGFPQGRQVMASSTGTVVDVVECCILHDALIAGGSSGGPLMDAQHGVLGLNTLLSKNPGDRANETDRAITVRMDFITKILASEQARTAPIESPAHP
jgi:S1-C subfamily serine protease